MLISSSQFITPLRDLVNFEKENNYTYQKYFTFQPISLNNFDFLLAVFLISSFCPFRNCFPLCSQKIFLWFMKAVNSFIMGGL